MAGMQVLGTTCEPFVISVELFLPLGRNTQERADSILVEANWLINHLRR